MKTKSKLITLYAIFGLIYCLIVFVGFVLNSAEEISYKGWGKPDHHLNWLYPPKWEDSQLFVQKKVNKLCLDFPVYKCPEVRVFFWSIHGPAALDDETGPNPVIFIRYKMIKELEDKELEAIINHEYGHLFLKTADQKMADKFSADIVGKEKMISALKKTPQFLPFAMMTFEISVKNEIQDRVEALEK